MVVGPRARELEPERVVEIGSLHFVLSQFQLTRCPRHEIWSCYTTALKGLVGTSTVRLTVKPQRNPKPQQNLFE
jgi:hypothetical protein